MRDRRKFVYLLLFFLTAISYIDRAALSVAAPAIARQFHVSPVEMGYLFSSFLWTYLICLIPVGLLVDRLGSRKVAASGITLWSLATIATGLSISFTTMLGTRLAMGAGEASVYPAGVRAIREWAPVAERGVAAAFLNGGAYAGPAIGALLTGWLVGHFGWRWGFIVAGAIGFLWLVPWLIWFRSPERASFLSDEERQTILTSRGHDAAGDATPSSVATLLKSRTMWGAALTQGCGVYAQYLFLTWLPSYLQATKGLNVQNAGLFTAIPYAAATLLGIAVCHLSDRRMTKAQAESGHRRRMVALMLLCSAVVLLTPLVNSVWMIVALVTLSLTGISSALSLNFALVSDLLRSSRDAGKAAGILVSGGNIFGILAPIVTGYVIAGTGNYNWAFGITGIMLIGGAILVTTMTHKPIQSEVSPASF